LINFSNCYLTKLRLLCRPPETPEQRAARLAEEEAKKNEKDKGKGKGGKDDKKKEAKKDPKKEKKDKGAEKEEKVKLFPSMLVCAGPMLHNLVEVVDRYGKRGASSRI
jgi:hypothetical protein